MPKQERVCVWVCVGVCRKEVDEKIEVGTKERSERE